MRGLVLLEGVPVGGSQRNERCLSLCAQSLRRHERVFRGLTRSSQECWRSMDQPLDARRWAQEPQVVRNQEPHSVHENAAFECQHAQYRADNRRAQCVFHDISDVLGEQLVLLLSEQHCEHVVQSIYVRFTCRRFRRHDSPFVHA